MAACWSSRAWCSSCLLYTSKFETEGNDYKDALANLTGGGVVTVHSGIVTRFGQLQTKLTQANLLHQGLFGFNLNNLLQSTVPVRTGRFKDLISEFRLSKNVLYVDELTYNGDDMRLWGAGKANLTRCLLYTSDIGLRLETNFSKCQSSRSQTYIQAQNVRVPKVPLK